MSVEGSATLSNATVSSKILAEGDLLAVDDVVTVGASGYVDIAYDRDWNNVTRVEENSSVRIRALFPTNIELAAGGIFAKLKSLPRESSFDVTTPTAIATVRGTEYRTTYLEGQTEVYNVSDSDVYVFGLDTDGQAQSEPVVIRNAEKTFIQNRGQAPIQPRAMQAHEVQRAGEFQKGVEQRVMQNIGRGRVGKLPDVGSIERRLEERRQQGGPGGMNKRMEAQRERMQQQGQGKPEEGRRPGQPQTMSGDEARQKVKQRSEGGAIRSGEGQPESGGFRSGQGMKEQRPRSEAGGTPDNRFEGRGIGQPFFPGDERHRSGGPEPSGFPDQRWKNPGEQRDRSDKSPEARQHGEAQHRQNPGGNGPSNQGGGQNKPQQNRQGGGKPAGRPQR